MLVDRLSNNRSFLSCPVDFTVRIVLPIRCGLYSDLSIGSSGAPTGYSMILTRTEKGRSLIDSLLATGYIERYIIPADQISEWRPKKINWLKKMTSLKVKK